jgi:hypothetical protein
MGLRLTPLVHASTAFEAIIEQENPGAGQQKRRVNLRKTTPLF